MATTRLPFVLYLRCLTAGVVTAVMLVTSWTLVEGIWAGCARQNCLIPLGAQVSVAFSLSLIDAVIIAACCVPVWLMLAKNRLANIWTAALLGFIFPLSYWAITNLPGQSGRTWLLVSGLPYAFSGLVAALVCWRTGDGAKRGGR
jgi:hypothetical protein